MGDIFHPDVPWEFLDQIWSTMGCCDAPDLRHLTFQILTKRPAIMMAYQNYRESTGMVFNLPNLWVGVSVEDQDTANHRIRILNEKIKATVKFVSLEPLLGPVVFRDVPGFNRSDLNLWNWWMIVGGESGNGARSCDLAWIRSIIQQCKIARVPVHVKQLGRNPIGDWYGRPLKKAATCLMDNQPLENTPFKIDGIFRLNNRDGKDPSAWPEDLRIQEFPNAMHA
jgi:protein gp37